MSCFVLRAVDERDDMAPMRTMMVVLNTAIFFCDVFTPANFKTTKPEVQRFVCRTKLNIPVRAV